MATFSADVLGQESFLGGESIRDPSGDTAGTLLVFDAGWEEPQPPWQRGPVPCWVSRAELGPMGAGPQCANRLALEISHIRHSTFLPSS